MPKKKRVYPAVSIYLSKEETEEAGELAKSQGLNRHKFLQYGLRYFIAEFKKDPGILKKESKEVLSKPE